MSDKSIIEYVEEYVDAYELRGDSGDYQPTGQERILMKDVIFGLIEDEDFINMFKEKKGEAAKSEIAFTVYLMEMSFDYNLNIEDIDKEVINRHLTKWKVYFLPSLQKEHSGDCTKECHTCTRCFTERIFKAAEGIKELLDGGDAK